MSSYGKCMDFPINLPHYEKMQQNPWYGKNLGNCYSYFSHSIGVLFYQIPILWYASSHVKWMGFIIKLPIALKNPLNGEGLETWFPYFFDKMGEFFHQITILQYTLSYGKCMSFLINFPQHRKRQEKPLNGKAWEIDSQESLAKPIVCREPGKLIVTLFPQYGCSFLIRFSSYGIHYNM